MRGDHQRDRPGNERRNDGNRDPGPEALREPRDSKRKRHRKIDEAPAAERQPAPEVAIECPIGEPLAGEHQDARERELAIAPPPRHPPNHRDGDHRRPREQAVVAGEEDLGERDVLKWHPGDALQVRAARQRSERRTVNREPGDALRRDWQRSGANCGNPPPQAAPLRYSNYYYSWKKCEMLQSRGNRQPGRESDERATVLAEKQAGENERNAQRPRRVRAEGKSKRVPEQRSAEGRGGDRQGSMGPHENTRDR